MTRVLTRRTVGTALAGLMIGGVGVAGIGRTRPAIEPPVGAAAGEPITVQAQPVTRFQAGAPDRVQFGQLGFRGGLVLTSPYRNFGGFSGLTMLDAERFVAISDRAHWLTGRIVYEKDRPAAVTDAAMAAMLGPDGRRLDQRGWYDTESLTADGGVLYVGIERVHRIVRFEFAHDGMAARARPVPAPPDLRRLPSNQGLEALAFVPRTLPLGGTLIAVPERGLDPAGNLKAYLIGGPTPGAFSVQRRDDFDVSDAAILPSGDLVLLERKFGWTSGLYIRLQRLPLAAIRPGVLVDGPILMTADLGYEIDNMEALGVHQSSTGEIVLTLLSDDNFSILQRTLLLQFTLRDEA